MNEVMLQEPTNALVVDAASMSAEIIDDSEVVEVMAESGSSSSSSDTDDSDFDMFEAL